MFPLPHNTACMHAWAEEVPQAVWWVGDVCSSVGWICRLMGLDGDTEAVREGGSALNKKKSDMSVLVRRGS